MANKSLAVSPRPGNPVSEMASLIDAVLQHRSALSFDKDDAYLDYHRELSTLVGLGFTAVMAEGSRIRSCRPHLVTFLRYHDFTQHVDKTNQLAVAIAEIVCSAICPFRMLGLPLYYDDFVCAMINILNPDNTLSSSKRKQIKRTGSPPFSVANKLQQHADLI